MLSPHRAAFSAAMTALNKLQLVEGSRRSSGYVLYCSSLPNDRVVWMKDHTILSQRSALLALQTSPQSSPTTYHTAEPAMETPRNTGGDQHSTRPAHRKPPPRLLESFFWYINIPLAHVCWVVTMIDENGGLTGVRLEEFWRTFKMPHMGLSIAYYMLSTLVLPLLST